jgi:glc operon protein GlcG
MKTKQFLELADVKAIDGRRRSRSLANNWAVTIAIVDDGGHLLWLQRLDGAAPSRRRSLPPRRRPRPGPARKPVYEEIINGGRTCRS